MWLLNWLKSKSISTNMDIFTLLQKFLEEVHETDENCLREYTQNQDTVLGLLKNGFVNTIVEEYPALWLKARIQDIAAREKASAFFEKAVPNTKVVTWEIIQWFCVKYKISCRPACSYSSKLTSKVVSELNSYNLDEYKDRVGKLYSEELHEAPAFVLDCCKYFTRSDDFDDEYTLPACRSYAYDQKSTGGIVVQPVRYEGARYYLILSNLQNE